MAMLWDRADGQWTPSPLYSHQGSFHVDAILQSIPKSAQATIPALHRGILRLATSPAELNKT